MQVRASVRAPARPRLSVVGPALAALVQPVPETPEPVGRREPEQPGQVSARAPGWRQPASGRERGQRQPVSALPRVPAQAWLQPCSVRASARPVPQQQGPERVSAWAQARWPAQIATRQRAHPRQGRSVVPPPVAARWRPARKPAAQKPAGRLRPPCRAGDPKDRQAGQAFPARPDQPSRCRHPVPCPCNRAAGPVRWRSRPKSPGRHPTAGQDHGRDGRAAGFWRGISAYGGAPTWAEYSLLLFRNCVCWRIRFAA